ncbi:MAG TPA: hypothetical protein VMW52_10870, partial [Phycisphaerae bacterium]|nr:hypothetical protein [Phycisphaerae bacterium]
MRTYTNWDFISAFGGVAEMPDGTPVVLQADAAGALKVADADLLAELKLVALATAQHVTDATSAAAVDVACADGTRFVEGYCESSFYYKRA